MEKFEEVNQISSERFAVVINGYGSTLSHPEKGVLYYKGKYGNEKKKVFVFHSSNVGKWYWLVNNVVYPIAYCKVIVSDSSHLLLEMYNQSIFLKSGKYYIFNEGTIKKVPLSILAYYDIIDPVEVDVDEGDNILDIPDKDFIEKVKRLTLS